MIGEATARVAVVVALASVALCGCEYSESGEGRGVRVHVNYKPAWNLEKLGLVYSTDGGPPSARVAHPPDDTPLNPFRTTITAVLATSAVEARVTLLIDGSDTSGVVAEGSVSLVVPVRGFVEAEMTLYRTHCDEQTPEISASICDDGNACTDESCIEGRCVYQLSSACQCSVDADCDDANPCTNDECTPSGCMSFNNFTCSCTEDAECDDGLWCNGIETCDLASQTCIEGTPPDCSGLASQCSDGVCDEQLDSCVEQQHDNGSLCDDANLCTRSDTCQSGSCVGELPVECARLSDCHDEGVCDPETGECSNPMAPNGTSCTSDGHDCTTGECSSGTCIDACTCNDERKNQGEAGIDCGGPCPPCDGGGHGGPISTADFSLDKGCYAPGESVVITNLRDGRNGDDWWWQLPGNGEEENWEYWKDDSDNFPAYTLYDAPGSTGEYEMRFGPDDCDDEDYTSSLTFQVDNSCR